MSAAIILSAGESSRMGSPKALLEFQGETFLDGLIRKLTASCDPVIVVLGHNAEMIRAATNEAAIFVVNQDYERGMLSSLQAGLCVAAATHADYALFTLVDHPNPAAATIQAVDRAPAAPVVIPRYLKKKEGSPKGHPVRISRAVMDELLALPAEARPTDVLYRYVEETLFLDLDDPGVVQDVDDPEAFARLVAEAGE